MTVRAHFPLPEDLELRREAARLGVRGGRAMGYAILLKPGEAGSLCTLVHELVHVAQMERLGRYFAELDQFGFFRSPLEWAARDAVESYRAP